MNNKKEKDKCVACDKDTPYSKDVNIDLRTCYVEGAGQLCENCWDDIYIIQNLPKIGTEL